MTNWEIPAALDGERVDRAVALLTGLSRAHVSTAVEAGQVRVGGRAVRARGRRVRAGERVELDHDVVVDRGPAALVGDPTVAVPVVYEDDQVVVVDKPAGLVVHPGAGHHTGTLVQGLLARYPDLATVGEADRPGIVHRLDQGTSGLLAVARTEDARAGLVGQLAAHTVERRYLTVVWGDLEAEEGLVDGPLGRADGDPTRITVRFGGRMARTRYRVLGRFATPATGPNGQPATTLLECRLETGRTHQIRVHLASIGHPVVGDERYGRRGGDGWRALPPGRPFLHAAVLGFDHPVTGERVRLESPLPPDLAEALATLAPR